jgi:hypothetical protein
MLPVTLRCERSEPAKSAVADLALNLRNRIYRFRLGRRPGRLDRFILRGPLRGRLRMTVNNWWIGLSVTAKSYSGQPEIEPL